MCWSAMLAVFSVLLEESDDFKIIDLCIEGFAYSIKITGHYNMQIERDAFVSSLSKFTSLTTTKEIKEKNVDCIKALLNLAIYDGNVLRQSWYFVLDCISKIDYMLVLGSGAKKDHEYMGGHKKTKAAHAKDLIIQNNSECIVQNIDQSKIDLIFSRSVILNPDAIIDFIAALCTVSKQELADKENPRVFSLQRLVEVADFNMNRIRFVWSRIWLSLGQHFEFVGSHSNHHLAEYAIDSLRQLAFKFLLKEEFGSYNFQRDFLKPFETIMINNLHTRYEIKEFIVTCISNMCHAMTNNIKSGWTIILNIFSLSAQDSEEYLVKQSFSSLDNVVRNHF
jgi:brefeldin A-inhibited guanine nucleotide-exchange protein